MSKTNLKELAGGAVQEQFSQSFDKVMDNLQNPNTPYKNVREITIKLKFVQNEARDDVKCGILVSEKLAPQSPMETAFSVGKDLRTGEIYYTEYGKQLRGQMSMADVKQPEPPVNVDQETGEVLPEHTDNVVDFRNIAAK